MSEYDQRQYRLMKQCIEGFENGNLNLRVLINSLRSLLDVLQEARQEWKTSFRSEWWILEEVYAVASDRGQTHLDQEGQNLVYEAIDKMKQLLKSVIDKNSEEILQESDESSEL
jgi:hypothetical protein